MTIDREKLRESFSSASAISEALANMTDEQKEEMNARVNKSLTELHDRQEEYDRNQREFFGRCNCPGFCYFHSRYDI